MLRGPRYQVLTVRMKLGRIDLNFEPLRPNSRLRESWNHEFSSLYALFLVGRMASLRCTINLTCLKRRPAEAGSRVPDNQPRTTLGLGSRAEVTSPGCHTKDIAWGKRPRSSGDSCARVNASCSFQAVEHEISCGDNHKAYR
jgi:hypothetical protein